MDRPDEPARDGVQVFSLKRGWRAFMGGAGLLMLLVAWAGIREAWGDSWSPPRWIMLGILLFLAPLALGGIYFVLRPARLWLFNDGRIRFEHWFSTREIVASQMSGFRLARASTGITLFVWEDPEKSPVFSWSLGMYERPDAILDWFLQRMPDLYLQDAESDLRRAVGALPDGGREELRHLRIVFSRLETAGRWLIFAFIFLILAHRMGTFPVSPEVAPCFALVYFLVSLAVLLRVRRLLLLAESPIRFDSSRILLPPVFIIALGGCWCPTIEDPGILLRLIPSALVAVVVAWVPGAPVVRLRERLQVGGIVLFLLGGVGGAWLNVALSPWPERTTHDAVITELRAEDKNRVFWRLNAPIPGVNLEQGVVTHRLDGLCEGDRMQVEISRGGLGYHWISGHHFSERSAVTSCPPRSR